MSMSARIVDSIADEVIHQSFRTKKDAEEYFEKFYFSFSAEIKERGNILPVGIKRAGTNHVFWTDDED